jgi:hypothetical protein
MQCHKDCDIEGVQPGSDSQAKTARAESQTDSQDRTARAGHPGEDSWAGYLGSRIAWTGQSAQFGLAGQPRQASLERTDGTSQQGQVSLVRSVWIYQREKPEGTGQLGQFSLTG